MLWFELLLSGLIGALLGAFFFGGLWWTVNRLSDVRRPALWVLGSFAVRTGAVLAGFYLVLLRGEGEWRLMVAALAGFITARIATLLMVRSGMTVSGAKGGKEDDH